VGEEADTVETVAEPFLVREGFMVRTPRGRAATPLAWEHLGLAPPRSAIHPGTTSTGRFGAQEPLLPLDEPGRFGG
jgi:Holliday junction DNA helicase RuvB